MRRREDWPERMHAALAEKAKTSFAWGVNDCALFAADIVLAMTGVDPCADLRDRYSDATGALAVLRPSGRSLEDEATARLGEPLEHPNWAQRGDVVSVGTDDGPALGICLEKHIAVMTRSGLASVPRASARKAWRV